MRVPGRVMSLGLLIALWGAGPVAAGPVTEDAGLAAQATPSTHPSPLVNATHDERRAFYQKRAAEREAWGETSTALAPRPLENTTPEEKRAYWRKRAAAREAAQGGTPARGAHAGHEAGMGRPTDTGHAAAGAPHWSGSGGRGDGVLWLTDAAPFKRDGKGGGRPGSGGKPAGAGMAGGQMGGMGEGGKDAVPTKRVWLRAGGNPKTARPATAEESALVQGPDGKTSEIAVEPHGGPYNVKFPTPAQGSYTVYFSRRALERDTLTVSLAKAEVMAASMGHGTPKDVAARLVMPRTESRIPVEIVRERKDKETPFTRLNYGDEIAFQVLKAGVPVQNARVTFTSGQGWSNSAQSDEDGRATFTVIRDYYPRDWSLFDKRHRETYLVAASFSTPEAGEYQGGPYASTRYTATLSGAYYPGTSDYESYSDGLLVGGVGLLFTGTSVWWFRRRRVRPYREVRFDD